MLKENIKQFFQLVHNVSVEFYTCIKLTIEILFEIWFDVDSYVQL